MSHPLEYRDFSGGVTDYFIDASRNKYQTADNFVIFKYGQEGRLFTRPGSTLWDEVNPQIPAGAQRVGLLKFYNDTLFSQSARSLYYISGGTYQTLVGPSSNSLFPSGVTVANYAYVSEGQGHLLFSNDNFDKVQKVYYDGATPKLRTAGLPLIAAPTVAAGAADTKRYIYRFHLRYTYLVGTLEFEDNGPTVEVTLENAQAPDVSTVAITAIPVLANGSTHNYDTASSNLKVMISRTTDAGQAFYYVGSVNNGTTTFNDNTSDATLLTKVPLYTEGGYVESEEPPLCKYTHITEDKGYYAHVKEGSEVNPRRVLQSIPGDIDGVPADFYCDVDHEITGINSYKGIPIVGTLKGVFRIEGEFTAQGLDGTFSRRVSDTASCVSHLSMVQTPVGLFWAGLDGFYWSDGYNCFRVSDGWDKTYQEIVTTATKRSRIYGKYDSKNNRIYWACSRGAENLDNQAIWCLSLDWGVSSDMPFTSWSGTSFSATALEVDTSGNMHRGDRRGYIMKHSDTLYVDDKVQVLVTPTDWTTETIMYNYISAATNFGTIFQRKWVTGVNIMAENETNLSLQIISNNDKGRKRMNLAPVRFRGNLIWGEDDVFWGDANLIWNYSGLISEKRRMPAGHLRLDYKQIELVNAKVAIFNSDILGTCDVNQTLKTALLNNGSQEWPSAALDYFISFEQDNYTREYTITDRTDDTLTFTDPQNRVQDRLAQKWVIRGYPRNEVLNLIAFDLHFDVFGQTQDQYRNSTSGEVGSSS